MSETSETVLAVSTDTASDSPDIKWLKNYEGGWQFGEAGVIHAITKRVGHGDKYAVEFGGGNFLCRLTVQRLVNDGWNALLIEADDDNHKSLVDDTKDFEHVKVLKQYVDPIGTFTLENTLKANGFPTPDVLVIDVDSDDYYMLASCANIKARILCVEHHDTLDPKINHKASVVPSGETIGKLIDGFNAQANIVAIEDLAISMGYKRVWHSRVNSIFVLEELYERLEREPDEGTIPTRFEFDNNGKHRGWTKIEEPKVSLILSQPRLCFTDHSDRLINLASRMKFNTFRSVGAFWDRDIEITTINAINIDQPDFLLYSDYDSVFYPADVMKLVDTLKNDPTIAAIGSVQMSRHDDKPLVFEADRDYSTSTTRVEYQHFGLTLIRRQAFEELPHPWLWSTPGMTPDGKCGWDAVNRSDADITFWRLMRNNNFKIVQHNEVVIGHMVLCVKWPKDSGSGVSLQPIENYNKHGKPVTAKINQDIYRAKMLADAKKVTTNG